MKKESSVFTWFWLAVLALAFVIAFSSCAPASRLGEKKDRFTLSRGMWGGNP